MKRALVGLLLFAAGCSTAPVADFLDWVSPSQIRPQGVNPAPIAAPALPPTTPVPVIPTPPPEPVPGSLSFKTPPSNPKADARPMMPPLPDSLRETRGQ
jgi:hypothetical protein